MLSVFAVSALILISTINVAAMLYAYDRLVALIAIQDRVEASIARLSYIESRKIQDDHVRSVGPTIDYMPGIRP